MLRVFLLCSVLITLSYGCDNGGSAQSETPDAMVRVDTGIPMCGTPEYMCPTGQECQLGMCVQVAIPPMPAVGGDSSPGGTQAPSNGNGSPPGAMDLGGGDTSAQPGMLPGGGASNMVAGNPADAQGGAQTDACARDFDCPVGEACRDGQCMVIEMAMAGGAMEMPSGGMDMPGTPCMVTSDCPAELLCDRGACVHCRLDRDCGDNQRCEAGNCEDVPPECVADNDCRADGSQRCIAGTCEVAECFGDNQCRAGTRCIARSCVAGARGNGSGSCAMPTPLAIGEVARGTPQGGEQHQGTCSINADISGPEAVYAFTAPFSGPVCFTTAWYRWTGFIPDIYVRSGVCGNGMELSCATGNDDEFANLASDNNQAATEVQVVQGETYHVFVDARISIDGDETHVLSALRGPCNGVSLPTACDEMHHMEIGQPFDGDSTFGSQALEGSCGDARDDGAEQVVHFRSGARPGQLCVRIDPNNAGSTASLYVRKTSCRDGNELACTAERDVALRQVTIAADPDTDYFVVVDTSSQGSPYRLLVEEGACP